MYREIRMILATAIILALLPLLRRPKFANKIAVEIKKGRPAAKRRLPVVLIVIFLLLNFGFSFLPVENWLIEFPTAEAVFRYNRFEQILQIVEGEHTAMVMYKITSGQGFEFYPKASPEGGYKLDITHNAQSSVYITPESHVIIVYNLKNKSDFYVNVTSAHAATIQHITDNRSSTFQSVPGTSDVSYTAYVKDMDYGSYVLIIDGVEFALDSGG